MQASHPTSHTFDGLRGLAVLIVFLSHSSGRDMALTPWLQFQGIGHIGVYLFFVLSAFLLTQGLMNGLHAGTFYMRRFFRIVPLYYAVIAGVLAYQAQGHFDPRFLHIQPQNALAHFLFLTGDGLFWTIPAEVAFYALLPWIVLAIARFGIRWIYVAAVAYFVWFTAARLGLGLPSPRFVRIGHHAGQYLDVFLCGVAAAYWTRPINPGWSAFAFWGLLLASVLMVGANVLGFQQPLYSLRWLSLLYGAVFAVALVSASQGNTFISRPLSNPVLRLMGRCAFGWYLLHFAIFSVVEKNVLAAPQIRFLIAALACAAIAWIANRFIERPFISLGRRLETSIAVRAQI